MIHRLGAVLAALALVASFSAVSLAGDSAKAGMKKEMATGPMKSVSCPTPCEFSVHSHDEKEIVSIVKAHAKKKHKMDMTDKQVMDMIKTDAPAKP